MRQTACAVTGHRPSRFKFKYSEDYSLCKKIKRAMFGQFKKLYDEQGVLSLIHISEPTRH